MTNKELLNQALRHVHFAQGFLQRFDANTDNQLYYYVDDILEKLDRVEKDILNTRRVNEQD